MKCSLEAFASGFHEKVIAFSANHSSGHASLAFSEFPSGECARKKTSAPRKQGWKAAQVVLKGLDVVPGWALGRFDKLAKKKNK